MSGQDKFIKKKPMWKGRLSGGLNNIFSELNASIDFDKRLWPEDLRTNKAYLKALNKAGLVVEDEYKKIEQALKELETEFNGGKVTFRNDLEDIHMHIEDALLKKAGGIAGKIHTGRSRNDQVATDLRLFVKDASGKVLDELKTLVSILIKKAEDSLHILFPAYTHMQRAQPTVFAHWFLAYAEMALRDFQRFKFARTRADASPLGLGACTGNPFDIDREFLMNELGFSRLCRNSLDGVSDRDFVLDFLFAAAGLFIHFSRMAEDLILYSGSEFRFVEIADELSTGSSMMPQKRNPDSLELARGKTGRVFGNLFTLMTVLKGLPLTYNKDLQEDKEPLFDTVDTVLSVIPMIRDVTATMRINKDRCREALQTGYIEATAVADYLTIRNIPFRTAYRIVGKIVLDLSKKNLSFKDLNIDQWRIYSEKFNDDIQEAIKPETIVAARKGIGGTAPEAAQREINRIRSEITRL